MVNESYSVYPNQLDGYASLPIRQNAVHEIRAEDHNRLRDAIIKIEQELGVQPSAEYATVSDRLDNIGDARNVIDAHIADTTDAHDASSISVADSDDLFYYNNVETVLNELGLMLDPKPDNIGEDLEWVPNSGIPSFYDGYGTKFVYNISDDWAPDTDNEVTRTQTRATNGIRGVHILEVSPSTNNGIGTLAYEQSTKTLTWQAPGDSVGASVDISGLATGETAIIYSSNTSFAIRIARNSDTLRAGAYQVYEELFEVYGLEAVTGTFSILNYGFKESPYITRTATSSTGVSRNQFMISGMVYPANMGTLVLQRKLRNVGSFYPIATLDLSTNFDANLRTTLQPVYIPSLDSFDTITLYDRLPAQRDYAGNIGADGNQVFENFTHNYYHTQMAKYLIPISNSVISGGELTNPDPLNTIENVELPLRDGLPNLNYYALSAYRIVHYKDGVTNFNGEPDADDIFSMGDVHAGASDGNTPIRFSNVFVDSNPDRPGVEEINVTPPRPDVAAGEEIMYLSGIRYYAWTSDSDKNRFGFRVKSNDNLASLTYIRDGILRFNSPVFNFPNGIGADGYSSWGAWVDLGEIQRNDGYDLFSDLDLPEFDSKGWYVVDSSVNSDRKLTLPPNRFSSNAFISARFYDPFGPGDGYDGYGDDDSVIFERPIAPSNLRERVLVNSYSGAYAQSTNTQEYFTDENYRIGYEMEAGGYENFLFQTDNDKFTHSAGTHIQHQLDGYVLAEWDNEVVIGPESLQCGARWISSEIDVCGLIYPQNNYAAGNIMPFQFDESILYDGDGINITYQAPQTSGTAYFAASYDGYGANTKAYQRLFNLGYPINNARLRVVSGGDNPAAFGDIAYYNESRFGKIEVKIPGNDAYGSTNWLDIGRLFESGGYEDGYGALHGLPTGGTGDFTVPFTFGHKNNADSGNMVAVRVTYFATDRNGSSILDTDTKTRIITMLELLPPISSE